MRADAVLHHTVNLFIYDVILHEVLKMSRWYLISIACIFLRNSAVKVHVSHANGETENTSTRRSLILYFKVMFLSLYMIFSLASGNLVSAALVRISGLDPSSLIIAPKFLALN